jgi:hypothetical protein
VLCLQGQVSLFKKVFHKFISLSLNYDLDSRQIWKNPPDRLHDILVQIIHVNDCSHKNVASWCKEEDSKLSVIVSEKEIMASVFSDVYVASG